MPPTLSIFFYWLVLAALFAGLGTGLRWLIVGQKPVGKFADSLWAGWAVHLVVLMAWHFFWPVKLWPLALLTLLAIPGFLLMFQGRRSLWPTLIERRAPILLTIGCGLWLANYSTGPILCFDTGLYHLSAVRWNADYAIVPGLANLHDRLGVQCATHLSAAMFEFGRNVGRSHHLVLGLPFWIVTAEAIFAGWRLLVAVKDQQKVDCGDAVSLLGLIPLMYQIVDLPSHSSDLPAYLIVWTAALRLWRLDSARKESDSGYRWNLFLVVLLSSVAVTIKPSTLFFAAAAIVIVVVHALIGGRVSRMFVSQLLLGGAMVGLLWMGRGVVLSGYPVYPARAFGVSVDWKVPEPLVEARKLRTMAFTRDRSKPWYEVLGNDRWYDDWCKALPKEFWWLIRIAFCAGLLFVLAGAAEGNLQAPRVGVVFPAALVSLLGWFLTAPDPRFAGASLWMVVLGTLILAIVRAINRLGLKPATLVPTSFVLLGLLYLSAPSTLVRLPWRLDDKRKAIPTAQTQLATLPGGVAIRVPLKGDSMQLWDAELPNTPGVHPALEARQPGNLGAGFRIHEGTSASELLFPKLSTTVTMAVPAGYAANVLAGPKSDPAENLDAIAEKKTTGVALPSLLLLYSPKQTEATLGLEVSGPSSSTRLTLMGTIGGGVTSELVRQPSGKLEATLTLKRGLNVFRLTTAKDLPTAFDLQWVALTLQETP